MKPIECHTVPISDAWRWVKEGFYIVRQQPFTWILLGLALVAVNILVSLLPQIGTAISFFIGPFFSASFVLCARKGEQGQELELQDLFLVFKQKQSRALFSLAALSMVIFIVSLVMASLIFGLIAYYNDWALPEPSTLSAFNISYQNPAVMVYILLTLVFAYIAYLGCWFAPALIVLRQCEPLQAIMYSFKASLQNIVPLIVYSLWLSLFALLALIPFGLGLLLWLPTCHVANYLAWKSLFGEENTAQKPTHYVL